MRERSVGLSESVARRRQDRARPFGAALATAVVLAAAATTALRAAGGTGLADLGWLSGWTMIGNDVTNSRHQPGEWRIGARQARQLEVKWALTTAGDVSATPAVEVVHGGGSWLDPAPPRTFVYFPDWGGKFWKVDGDTGAVIWSRSVSDYNEIAGSVSRSSPVLGSGAVYIADLNGHLIAVDTETGDPLWITRIDPHPATTLTTSPILLGNRLYIATSSNETAYARANPSHQCCTFRGSLSAVDTRTGNIVWQSFVLPDNGGKAGGFSGGAFVNPPAIDVTTGLIYAGAGQLYTQPQAVTECLAAAEDRWDEACFPRRVYFNSVVAFDLRSGRAIWGFRGAGRAARDLACGSLPDDVDWCPPAANLSIWDFAGSGANVFDAWIGGSRRRLVGIGQKSGVYWALDARTGRHVWSTLVGPGSDPGGIQWGTAYDGRRIYAAIGHNTGQPYRLPTGDTITGGSFAALDPSNGRILWQTPDPLGAPDLAALTVANGVVYGGSMSHTGDQMYALDAQNGRILWRFAAGGSVVAGPAVVDGRVYWGSGYARTGGVGNDKFYAFSVGGE